MHVSQSQPASQSAVRDRRLPRGLSRNFFVNNTPGIRTGRDLAGGSTCMSHLYVGRGSRHASPPPPNTHVPFIFIRMPTCVAKCQDEEHRSGSDPWGSSAGKHASPQKQQQQSKHTTARSSLAREQVSWAGILARYVVSKDTTSREVPWLLPAHPSIHPHIRTYARTHAWLGGGRW
jgi:hypothetical protein